ELTSSFGIQSIPTLIVFKNGEIVNKAVGARSKEDILAMVK
ncbi:MAG: thioredoxin family protein, partial [Clostridia bacterium]|nr:thioredoxin family protein [Clostridia bacterium]